MKKPGHQKVTKVGLPPAGESTQRQTTTPTVTLANSYQSSYRTLGHSPHLYKVYCMRKSIDNSPAACIEWLAWSEDIVAVVCYPAKESILYQSINLPEVPSPTLFKIQRWHLAWQIQIWLLVVNSWSTGKCLTQRKGTRNTQWSMNHSHQDKIYNERHKNNLHPHNNKEQQQLTSEHYYSSTWEYRRTKVTKQQNKTINIYTAYS